MENLDLSPIISYDNITIVILFVIMLAQWVVIAKLLNAILSMKDVLTNLSSMIAVLNERLHKHD
jgi:hypothetical protein